MVVFRVFFGIIMCIDLVWHLLGRAVEQVWVLPRLHFKYYGFEWVATWPGDGMYWHCAALAVRALRSRVAHSATTPVWTLWLLRGQVALVYFYGGVAKLNADCLQGEPMRLRYLAPWQRRVIVNDPDMILQLCRYLKEEKRRQGYADYEVYAHINVSLNGRPPQLMLDPSVDLASQSRALLPAPWIKRLTVPLPAR